jgi:PAS domain S-box-containing protein
LNQPTLSRPPFGLSTQHSPAYCVPELCAVLVLDTSGRVTAANLSARSLWPSGDREPVGAHVTSLIQFDQITREPGLIEAQWKVLLDATLDQNALLITTPRSGVPRQVVVRLETHVGTGSGYFATVQPAPLPPPPTPVAATKDDFTNFQLLTDRGAAGFFDLNLKTGRAYYSAAWKRMLGYEDAGLPDSIDHWRQLIHPDDSAAAPDQPGKKLAIRPRAFSVEFRMKHRLGQWVWIHCLGLQVPGALGELEQVVGLHLDITERKELDETCVANDTRMQTLSSMGPLGAFELDFTGKTFWFSPAWKKILGFDESECPAELATFVAALPPNAVAGGPEAWLSQPDPGQTSFLVSSELRDKSGAPLPLLLGAHRTFTRKKDLVRVTGFICPIPPGQSVAINTYHPVNLALAGGVEPHRGSSLAPVLAQEALSTVAEGVVVVDGHGKVCFVNPVAVRLLQRPAEAMMGQPVTEVFKLVNRESGRPVDDPFDRALTASQPLPLISQDALVASAGSSPTPIVWTARAGFDPDGKPHGVVIAFRDPAEMNLTPEELVKANRFETLGMLAGGIAHDFNNLLTTILGGISLAKDNRDYSALEDSEKACMTAKGLTRQLLSFAKGGGGTSAVLPVQEILSDSIKIASAGSTAEVTLEIAERTAPVMVDRAQILQVFQNLIVNALQAMPPPPHRPKVQVIAANVNLKDGQVVSLAAGDYVQFDVRDNGSGIPPEYLPKIFDPFFTTKKHGTGLGLATVQTIVRKHGGQITLKTAVGAGTAFTIYLPHAGRAVEVQARKAPTLRFGTGRVLFMDDDATITSLTATMLKSLDYKFDLAKSGEEAIVLYKRYLNIGRPYDAVIMDIGVIGGMGAEETFQHLKKLDSDVRAIISSGYDNEDIARRFLDAGFCGHLTKPYRVTDLGKLLKTVLG